MNVNAALTAEVGCKVLSLHPTFFFLQKHGRKKKDIKPQIKPLKIIKLNAHYIFFGLIYS